MEPAATVTGALGSRSVLDVLVPGYVDRSDEYAEFAFDGGVRVFADPTWTFGIRLGGHDHFERWAAQHADGAGGMTERLWTPRSHRTG